MKPNFIHAQSRSFSDYVIQKFAGVNADGAQTTSGDGSLAGAAASVSNADTVIEWNGLERRRNSDRRQQSRRQYRTVSMLDTRTQADRRSSGRRQSDRLITSFVACKV